MSTFIAYNYGKMNQSFTMKDEANNSLFEANLIKFFSASDFEFVNKKTGATSQHKVGKTRTTESHRGAFNFSTSSYFKFDGQNVFDILDKKGYYFKIKVKLDIVHPEFALVDKNKNEVAVYKLNVLGEKQENVKAIGNKQRNTVITTLSDDLDAIFLGAFILSRVDFSAYLV